eukprot:11890907-Heterocapsa_arctica.AAC.1
MTSGDKKEWYNKVKQVDNHVRSMFAINQPKGLELQHSPWIILAWLRKEHLSHGIVVAPILHAQEGIIMNLNS